MQVWTRPIIAVIATALLIFLLTKSSLTTTNTHEMAAAATASTAASASASAFPKLKLLYFNGRGRAERCRLLFAETGIPYEDARFEEKDWPAFKSKQPYGQVPTLTVGDTTVIAQSAAIERYIARIGKLMGKDALDEARINMVAEGVVDMRTAFYQAFWTKDESEKKVKLEAYFKDEFPRWTTQLTSLLEQNGNGGVGWFVGNEFSYADLTTFASLMEIALRLNKTSGDLLKAVGPAVNKLAVLVGAAEKRPKIAAWIASRPVTSF